jgi:AcrR family transcriptional regulator
MKRTPGQRAGLSFDAVLAAARDLIADDGADRLTMRALAERLDVAPNALYSYVANKTALLDAVLDSFLADVDLPSPDIDDPVAGIFALMASSHAVLLQHRDLVPLYLERQGSRGPFAQRLGEVTLGLFARAGITGQEAREAMRVLIVFTIGFAAMAPRMPDASESSAPLSEGELRATYLNGLRWLLAGIGLSS